MPILLRVKRLGFMLIRDNYFKMGEKWIVLQFCVLFTVHTELCIFSKIHTSD